jgi:hypothetical protein
LLCPQAVYSQEQESSCNKAAQPTLLVIGGLGLAALEIVTLVCPPVFTHKLLEDGPGGLQSCIPKEILNNSSKDTMNMAQTAFIVNAATIPVAITSFIAACSLDSKKWGQGSIYALGALGAASWLAGLGAELAGLIQSQKAYNQIFGGNIDPCSKSTSDGSENPKKSDFKTVLGFSYVNVIVNGLATLGVGGALLYQWSKQHRGTLCAEPNV